MKTLSLYGFNNKPISLCKNTINARWKTVFDGWLPAKWTKASYRGQGLEWKSLDPVTIFEEGTSYDFASLYDLFSVASANWVVTKEPHPLAIQVKSEVLCKLKPIQQMLDVAVCDCVSGDNR